MINIHRIDKENTGDMVSSPLLYFEFNQRIELDILKAEKKKYDGLVVFGGGGLIHPDFIDNLMGIAKLNNYFFWGAGMNHAVAPKELELDGIRDIYPNSFWVPCVSCMSRLFDREYTVHREFAVLEHHRRPLDFEGLKKINNSRSFEEIVNFIGSTEVLLTNTYHGVYWGTLLGRKVVCVNPFSNKFFYLKYRVPTCVSVSLHDIELVSQDLETFPFALEECRKVNRVFYERMISLGA